MSTTPDSVRFSISLPVAVDAFGRWMEDHGATVTISVALGSYRATVAWRKLHSYSDATGQHVEEWRISRDGATAVAAVTAAMDVALRVAEAAKK